MKTFFYCLFTAMMLILVTVPGWSRTIKPILEYKFDSHEDRLLFSSGKAMSPLEFHPTTEKEENSPLVLSKGLCDMGLDLRLGGYVAHQDNLAMIDGLQQMTICGWIYSSAPFDKGRIWVQNQDDRKNGFKLYEVNDQGVLRFEVKQKGAPIYSQLDSDPGFLVTDCWNFFAITFDGNRPEMNVRFYRNSKATLVTDAYMKFSTGYTNAIAMDQAPLSLCGSDTESGKQFPALIDNFRLYDKVLSPRELEEIRATDVGTIPGKGLNIYCYGDSMVKGCCGGPYLESFGTGGFRYYLEQIFLDGNFAYTFSGEKKSGTLETGGKFGPLFSPNHGGNEGEKIPELLKILREEQSIAKASPDLVIVYLGTPETAWIQLDQYKLDTENLKQEYARLLDEIEKQTNEKTTIFLCRLSPASSLLPHVNERVKEFNGEVVDAVFAERAESDRGANYHWIDIYGALDWETDLANIGHPNSTGHEKIANLIWKEIQTLNLNDE